MSKDIDNLIISVSNSLRNFTEGKILHKDAKDEFLKLLNKYEKIVNKLKKSEDLSQIQGLCYFNNIENYSILSGIYEINKNDILHIAYYGDSSLNSRTMKTILSNAGNIKENTLFRIPPMEDNNFLHNIYLFPLFSDKFTKTIFASVSSSIFFSEGKFLFLGKLIKNIFSVVFNESETYENDYFVKISTEIEKYFIKNIDDEYSVRATLFVFNMLEKIFNHMGIHSLLEVSDKIYTIIKDNFKHNTKCFALSIRDYIILEKINKHDSDKVSKNKIEFLYKNINIPYHSLKLNIDTIGSVYSLWDKILTFENYLSTGDITK